MKKRGEERDFPPIDLVYESEAKEKSQIKNRIRRFSKSTEPGVGVAADLGCGEAKSRGSLTDYAMQDKGGYKHDDCYVRKTEYQLTPDERALGLKQEQLGRTKLMR